MTGNRPGPEPRPALGPALLLAALAGTALQLQQAEVDTPVGLAAAVAVVSGVVALVLAVARACRLGRRAVAAQPTGHEALVAGSQAVAPAVGGQACGTPCAGRWRTALALRLLAGGLLLAVAASAFWAAQARAAARLADGLPPALEGLDLQVVGRIEGLPRVMPHGVLFELAVESAARGGQPVPVPRRLSLGWTRGWDGESLVAEPPQPVRAGERWQLTVRLKRPHGLFNPHGLDLELWLFERGLRATGTVRAGIPAGPPGAQGLDGWRQQLRDGLLQRATRSPDGDAGGVAAGVLAALAVGDQSSIDRADWDLFRTTGVGHLMSISGLHVTMWAWVAAGVVGALWRRSAWASQWLPAPVAARWGGLLLATGYALLAGWGVPAQRTVWMLAIVTLMRTGGRHWPAHTVLLTAAAVVVLLDPWALLQVGFWLSFVAVGLLMLGAPGSGPAGDRQVDESGRLPRALARAGRAVAAALRTQLVASLGLAPLTLLLFHELSVVGFVANLVAIPWVTAVVTPLALLSTVLPLAQPLAEAAVRALMALLAPMASWPGATWSAAAAPAGVGLLALAGGALAVAPLPGRLRLAGLLMVVPLLTHRADAPPWGEVRVVAFDVGQGTAVALQTQRHRLLYDTGPRPGGAAAASAPDAAHRVLLPWWRAQGRPVIDRLVLSHRDTDHTGGAATLLAQVPVRSSLSSLEDGHPLRDRLPAHQSCAAGMSWVWDGVRFEVLHPALDDAARGLKPNALSCVLRVVDRHGPRLLLTGDIEAAQEAELLARHADDPGTLRARHLLLPHHGSQTSSSPGLLDAVQPATAIAQAAYRNRFGHPSAEVVQRLAGRGITLHRSDRCGAWQWPSALVTGRLLAPSDDTGICQREHARRYWHHPGQP